MLEFIQSADEAILAFLRDSVCVSKILDYIMLFFTYLGEEGIIWIIFGVIMMILPKYRKHGVKMALALLVMLCINNIILKPVIARPRPFVNDPSILEQMIIHAPSSFSFPSGHTASSFAGACILAHANKKAAFWAYPLAILIAFSRAYLQVHYPSDIIAGALLGTVYAFIAILIFAVIEKLIGKTKFFNFIFR